jgi:trigger factor
VTLGQYTGIEVPREQPVITDEAVTAEMEALRRRLSTVADSPPEATLGVGGMATLDFAGAVDGRPFDGGTAEGYVLELGSGFLLPGFEEQLLGAKLGEDREVVVTFPVDARSDLAGKEARFKVTVKGYRVRQLPEPNDEFARQAATALGVTVGESGFGLDALRAELRRRLEASAEARARAVFEAQVIERVVRNAQLDVPAVMVRARAEALAQDFDRTLARQGMTRQAYLAAATETEEHLEQSFGSRAAAQLKRELVLEAIARKESIHASDQEVDERVTTLARLGGEEPARLRQTLADNQGLDGVRNEIVERKTIDYLMGAQVVVPAAAAAPETAAPETAALATAGAAAPATEAATPAAPAKKARRAPSKKTTGGKKAEEDVEVSVEPEADQAGKPGPQPKRPRTKGRATKEDHA